MTTMSDPTPQLETTHTAHGLTAVYLPRDLERWQRAELLVQLGLRRPADLEYLARRKRAAQRASSPQRSQRRPPSPDPEGPRP